MRWFRLIVPILSSILMAVVGVNYFSNVDVPVSPVNIEVSMNIAPGQGGTSIMLPPIGSLQAQTHQGPVHLGVRLDAVDLGALEELLHQNEPQKKLYNQLQSETTDILHLLLVRVLIVAAIAGALGYMLVGPRRWPSPFLGALIGVVLIVGLSFSAYAQFDLSALENPRFSGAMEYAPWMISFVQRSLSGIDQWGEKLEKMAGSMQSLTQRAEAASTLVDDASAEDLVLLHISDIHNNPAGYQMVKGIIDQFHVDMVVDTGDTSDFGTAIETELLKSIAQLKVPYLWVAGNHDSPEIIKAMQALSNVQVLEGKTQIAGLEIAGWPDPASGGNEVATSAEELDSATQMIEKQLTQEEPDLVMVHNHRIAEKLAGLAPVILTGHNHKSSLLEQEGTVIINAGSTGAEGLRGLQKSENSPYTAVLLYFNKSEAGYTLNHLDYLEFSAAGSGFSLDRKAVRGNGLPVPNSTGDRGQD